MGQQVGYLPGGFLVPTVGSSTQLVQIAALCQQASQPRRCFLVAAIGPYTQLIQIAALGQQPHQPARGVLVARVGRVTI